MHRHLSMREMALQIPRYHATFDQSSHSKRHQNIRAPYYQSDIATSKLRTRYTHNEESQPMISEITKTVRRLNRKVMDEKKQKKNDEIERHWKKKSR